jgi:hypothetical protein
MSARYSTALLSGALLALPVSILVIATTFWPDTRLMEPKGFYIGRDFLNYWTGGRLVLIGQVDIAYDFVRYNTLLRDWFSPEQSLMFFSYPPNALLLFAPLGALPYLASLALFSLLGTAGFVAVALGRRPQRDDAKLLGALLLAPIVWDNLVFGQFGLVLAVLFVGALRALPTRPELAGVLMGALTIKPQLGLLLALALLVLGAWRAIAAAVLTAALLAVSSIAILGMEPWHVYIEQILPAQWSFVTGMGDFFRYQMITPYAALWFLGVPVQIALALQAAISVLIAVTAYLALRSDASWPLKATVVAFGSLLVVPYGLSYDLAIPFAALVWYLIDGSPREEPAAIVLTRVLWALPFGVAIILQTFNLPVLPIAMLMYYFWLVSEACGWRPLRVERSGMAPGEA